MENYNVLQELKSLQSYIRKETYGVLLNSKREFIDDKLHEIICEIDESYLDDTYDSIDGGVNDLDTSMYNEE